MSDERPLNFRYKRHAIALNLFSLKSASEMFREFWLFTVFVAMLVSARQSNRVRTRSAQQVQPFPDPNWCWDNPDRNRLEHENCEKYWECDENNELFEEWCDEGWIFDFGLETCGEIGGAPNNRSIFIC